VIAGLAAVGSELLPALASEKYASASAILPWVIAGMVVDGTNPMLGAGLFIHRKTTAIMAITLSCALLNLGLNLILVPRIGIQGAAVATLVSYAATSLLLAAAGRRLLPIALPLLTLLRAGLASLAMYGAVVYVQVGARLVTVGVRMVLGATVYAGIMGLIDPDVRNLVKKALGRFRRGSS
jgi:O-antigen/teichoic acid export membrane protein